MRRDQMGRTFPNYYEEIIPAPGRPNERYRLEHIPFVTAMKTPGWSESPNLGQGPNRFYRHLQQARGSYPMVNRFPKSAVLLAGRVIVLELGAAVNLFSLYNRMHPTGGDRSPDSGDRDPSVSY